MNIRMDLSNDIDTVAIYHVNKLIISFHNMNQLVLMNQLFALYI